MTTAGWIQLLVFLGLIFVFTPILGGYMAKVWGGGKAPGDRVFSPIERVIYRVCGIDPESEQRWTVYTFSLLAFSAVSLLFVYGFQRLQSHLPFNPDHLQAVHPDLAWNTAASFITNTNWQSYGGESTMSHLTQMAGLAVQNFASAAAGLAVMVALIRGLTRRRAARSATSGSTSSARRCGSSPDRVRRRDRAREPGRGPELPRLGAPSRPSPAGRRRSPAARSRARSRSSSSARTAAASSTRTRRTRSRARTASRT